MLKKQKLLGFTLIELMVVITIISILSGIAVYGLTSVRQKAQDTSHLAGIRDYQLALEAFKSVNGKYPATKEELMPVFLNKLPSDSTSGGVSSYKYSVNTTDFKSYCVGAVGSIFKNTSQPDLVDSTNTKNWKACRGATPPAWP